jgi:hypothetical protein
MSPSARAGVGHQGRHAAAVDAVLLDAPAGGYDAALPGDVLVALA